MQRERVDGCAVVSHLSYQIWRVVEPHNASEHLIHPGEDTDEGPSFPQPPRRIC